MEISKSIVDIIRERSSCRSFSDKLIEPEKLAVLRNYLNDINSAMPIRARIILAVPDAEKADPSTTTRKTGLYDSIMGSNTFIIGILDRQEAKVERFGYQFEKVILFATGLDLSTCWLGGSFGRPSFEEKTSLAPGEYIPVIAPVGYAQEKRNLADHLVRFIDDANNRKPWNELFYSRWPDQSLRPDQEPDFHQPLAMARLSPSASNKQPWRVIKDSTGFHFYLHRTANYPTQPYDLQRNDMGIIMCHFELTARDLDLPGCWRILGTDARPSLDGLAYIASWQSALSCVIMTDCMNKE